MSIGRLLGCCVLVVAGLGAQSVDALCEALRLLDTLRFDRAALRAAAGPFAPEAFDRAFRAAFERGYAGWCATEPASAER